MKKLLLILLSVTIFSCTNEYKEAEELYNQSIESKSHSLLKEEGLKIGDTYQGGIIIYLDGNGGGLITAPSDQSTGAEWGCYGTLISGADGTAIGTGAQNTIDIVNANCSPITSGNLMAADICANLTLGGYSDWFLPSKDELNHMYLYGRQWTVYSGFKMNSYYWSSTEYNNGNAWGQNFYHGTQIGGNVEYKLHVRAVRAF